MTSSADFPFAGSPDPADHASNASRLSQRFHVQLFGPDSGQLGGDVEELHRFLGTEAQVYFEGDGSFGWSGRGWSLYGMLYDRAGKMQYAELQGCCPRLVWNQLIAKLTTAPNRSRSPNCPAVGCTVYKALKRQLGPRHSDPDFLAAKHGFLGSFLPFLTPCEKFFGTNAANGASIA